MPYYRLRRFVLFLVISALPLALMPREVKEDSRMWSLAVGVTLVLMAAIVYLHYLYSKS
jgi:hypothetical protein